MPQLSEKDKEEFFLGDLDVYIDADVTPAFYTRAEKPIAFSVEFARFLEGIPQVLVRKDVITLGMSINLEVMQWTGKIMQLARGGVLDESDPTIDTLSFGTEYTEPPIHKFTFSGKLRNGNIINFVIPVGQVSEMGEIPTGGTDYAAIPLTIEALKDESELDETKNLAYFEFGKSSS